MKAISIALSVWLIADFCRCQDVRDESIDVQQLTDGILSSQDDDLNYEDLYENIVQILSSPLDLNTTSAEELLALHILNDDQVGNLISWRQQQGALLGIYELQVVPGFDREIITKLLPFVNVVDPSTRLNKKLFQRMFSPGTSYVVTRYERTLETKRGFEPSPGAARAFAGSPDKVYLRMRSSVAGDFSIGFTGEKDDGERIRFDRSRNQWFFDFTSFHFQVRNKGRIANLIVGDFQAQFGQGLLFGGAFGLGKSGGNISTLRKSSTGFRPYTSVHEAAYQRGIALTVNLFSNAGVSFFYSHAARDASAGTDGDSLLVRSILSAGLHRTQKELLTMKTLKEDNTGLVLHVKRDRMELGLLASYIHFSTPLRKAETAYNQFAFSGKANFNTGVYLNYRMGNISFFSEAGKSLGGGIGAVGGLLTSPHPDLDFAILYRTYTPDFYTFYSNAFSENTQPTNERGFYWSWKYRWGRRYSINGYTDLFTFPWLGFRRYAPSPGYEWLMRGNYQPSKDVHVFLQVREESKACNLSETMSIYKVGERVRRNVVLNIDYGLRQNIRLRSRLQYSAQNFHGTVTEGWAFVQDIGFRVGKFEIAARHGLFDTEHYDNRQYAYERDAWSSYSLPSYSGIGVRNYVLFEYKMNKQLTFWFRYARTRILSDAEIGSGEDAIDGNTRNDVKFQARMTF